jgi:hypothetical protein
MTPLGAEPHHAIAADFWHLKQPAFIGAEAGLVFVGQTSRAR